MSILHLVRERAVCPPSLLSFDRAVHVDGFEQALASILDVGALSLADDPNIVNDFKRVLQMAERIDNLPVHMIGKTKEILEQRRCIILAIVGFTPSNNKALLRVLQHGYLNTIKLWLDQILNGSVGNVDLLLHLLTNIKSLPVNKSQVKHSGMGKAIGSIEKHRICAGSPNQVAITERVQRIKDSWNKSVKAQKGSKQGNDKNKGSKRQIDQDSPSSLAKRSKIEDAAENNKKNSRFSTLLRRVTTSPENGKENPQKMANGKDRKSQLNHQLKKVSPPPPPPPMIQQLQTKKAVPQPVQAKTKKPSKRVKWADHFGGNLTASRVLEVVGEMISEVENEKTASVVSWSDRKRRDRLREKELLNKAKKAKLVDEDDDMNVRMPKMPKILKPTIPWKQPCLLPDNPEFTKPQLNSKEIAVQIDRISKVTKVQYTSDFDVPPSPAPLSDIEQAFDMKSHTSAVVSVIPFFVAQQEVAQQPAVSASTGVAAAPSPTFYSAPSNSAVGSSSYPPATQAATGAVHSVTEAATAEIVQSLGLPMFLVGQNAQALKTLASSPGLLRTLVDPSGKYDQPRLMSLVQNITQNVTQGRVPTNGQQRAGGLSAYNQQQTPAQPTYGSTTQQQPFQPSTMGIYGPASTATSSSTPSFTQPTSSTFTSSAFGTAGNAGAANAGNSSSARNNGYRGDQNHSDTNLHLSGYGPTTNQVDIITLFSPYVTVDEVVVKGNFSFVNTSDPVGAKRAREALNGTLLGGMPVRINFAQRRTRDASKGNNNNNNSRSGNNNSSSNQTSSSFTNAATASATARLLAGVSPGVSIGAGSGAVASTGGGQGGAGVAVGAQMIMDENAVRDDRGNPATKNLFVAGYGTGTSEQQIRDIFGQHATIIGVVMKGTFSFVNTADRLSAIRAREALGGTVFNGGILRINFAKETGRLGTSFDLTYGPGGGQPATSPMPSHYGRSY